MKRNLSIAVLATLIVMVAGATATAQPGGMGGGMPGGGMPMGMPGMGGGSVSGLPDFDTIGEERSAALKERLGLDEKQTKQLAKLISAETQAKMNTILSNSSNTSMENMFRQMMGEASTEEVDGTVVEELDKIGARYAKKYQKLLSAEQYATYCTAAVDSEYIDSLMENVKQESGMPAMPGGMGMPMGGGGMPMGGM